MASDPPRERDLRPPSAREGRPRVRDPRPEDYADLRDNYWICYDERDAGSPIGIVLFESRPSEEAEAAWFAHLLETVAAGSTIAVVAEVDGHAIGLCSVARAGPSPDSETGHVGVLGILVRRGYRSAGVGSVLLDEVLARCQGTFEVIRLSVFADNEGARRLYERFGFVTVGRFPRAIRRRGIYHDEVLMARVG